MTEKEKWDEVLQRMAEITEAAKSGNTDPATMDWDKLKEAFEPQIKELVDAQVEERLSKIPARTGHPVYAEGVDRAIMTGALKNNRYGRAVRHIANDGYYKDFLGNKTKAFDLWLAWHSMNTLRLKAQATGVRTLPPAPSDDLDAAIKALTSTGSGTGDELVPTDFAAELWEDVYLSNVLVSALDRVPMTSNPMELPDALGDVTFRKGTENTATTASDPATAKNTLTVTEELAEVDWSYSLDEDAIIALMPAVRQTISRNAAEYMDGFALNADSTATASNINSDVVPGSTSYYLTAGQDGIRHQWLVDYTTGNVNAAANLTDAHINLALANIGKYAVDPRQVLFICDVWTYLRGFCNVATSNAPGSFLQYRTDQRYDVITTGEVAQYRGSPLVIPSKYGKAQATGFVSATAANNTLGSVSIINRSQWKVGFIREMEIEVDRDIQKRQTIMVVSFRMAVGCRGTRASATHTVGIRNVTVAS